MGSRPRAKLDSGLSLDIEQCKIKIKEFRISSSKQQPRDEEQFLTSVGRAVQPRLSNSLVRSLDKNALSYALSESPPQVHYYVTVCTRRREVSLLLFSERLHPPHIEMFHNNGKWASAHTAHVVLFRFAPS